MWWIAVTAGARVALVVLATTMAGWFGAQEHRLWRPETSPASQAPSSLSSPGERLIPLRRITRHARGLKIAHQIRRAAILERHNMIHRVRHPTTPRPTKLAQVVIP
jgi:hypothetical protein